MPLFRIIIREIVYRKGGFLVAAFVVAVAVGCVLGQLLILAQHDRRSEEILAVHEKGYRDELADLEKDIRVSTKNLGFNLVIFPKDVNLAHFASKGYIDSYMPEEYVGRLAKSPLVSINHLLPVLEQRVFASEVGLEIMVKGTVGEVAIAAQEKKKPFLEPVPRDKVTLGHELRRLLEKAQESRLNPGDEVKLLGRAFLIHKIQPKQLGPEDTTAWIHLQDAQDLLDKKGKINALYALGCNCTEGRLGVIREEIAAVLPQTQVEEFETKATARAEARTRAAEATASLLEQARKERDDMRAEKAALLGLVVPLILIAAFLAVAFLAWLNVGERRGEIGLFRALGWSTGRILGLVLGRSVAVGVVGTLLGLLAALIAGRMLGEGYGWLATQGALVGIVAATAPLASLAAAWLPSLSAALQDPAVVLQEELT